MSSASTLSLTYFWTLQTDLCNYLDILQTRLDKLEEVQQEIYDAQTYLLQNLAPLHVLAYVDTTVTYLSQQHQAIHQLIHITSNLLRIIQALIHSGASPP
jgi:hypothetical protein